jgi:putative transcriptional regulator
MSKEQPKNQSKIKSKVREIAERQGIKSSYGLQKWLDVAPTVAVNLWNDDVTRFSVETLELLCEKFNCNVADLLVYESSERRHMIMPSDRASKFMKPAGTPVEHSLIDASDPVSVVSKPKQKPVLHPDFERAAKNGVFNNSILEIVQSSSDNEYVLTTADAGEFLNLSPRTVRENAEKGLLHGKQGKQSHWFFRRSDIDNFIAQRGKE